MYFYRVFKKSWKIAFKMYVLQDSWTTYVNMGILWSSGIRQIKIILS